MIKIPSFYEGTEQDVSGENVSKTVRVGWYETPFNQTDRFGRRSGYGYEYQQKIAAYTGWNYEYVTGSWAECYQMLLDGEDLMSDISYTEERAENMLFTTLPMGSESYYMCVSTKRDSGIDAGDYSTVNGKRVGVNKGSFQEKLFREWMEKNDVRAKVVELTIGETEAIEMLDQGLVDVLVDIDAYGIIQETIPVCFVGSSDYYFVVNKSRPDLLKQLNSAMQRIQDEDRYFNQHLQEKYFSSSYISLYLSQDEVEWLSSHGPVRVGYRDDYLAFCGQDKKTGELIGALKDYLDISAGFLQNAEIEFETVPFTTMEESLQALKDGTIDCIFPVCLTDFDGEELGIISWKSSFYLR